jgi:hypothetical protein
MAMRDNVYFDADLPGPAPDSRWFVTMDITDHPDHASCYRVKPDGTLWLERHELAGLRDRLAVTGMLWQYPDAPDIRLGPQDFTGTVELWSEVAVYDAEFRDGRVVTVTLQPEADSR